MLEFKELPKINPKTEEETKLFICLTCGAITPIRKRHIQWHKELNSHSSAMPYWDGVDDLDMNSNNNKSLDKGAKGESNE